LAFPLSSGFGVGGAKREGRKEREKKKEGRKGKEREGK
jgi:hypothetical protein